jgi:hypothetical protein
MTDTNFEVGRYLYCAVQVTETSDTDVSMTGIDDEPVSLVTVDSLGVVVHECESLYDTAESAVIKKWLLQHQGVIDAAGETFGTPLPFQFDTILTGTDEHVSAWLADHSETLSRYLTSLAGHWEYRIEVVCDESQFEAELEATDERLMDLDERIATASPGTKHLLEKQYGQRLTELKQQRRSEQAATLETRLEPLAREVHELGDRKTTLDDEQDAAGTDAMDMDTQARLAVLAPASREAAIGDILDEIAAEPGIEVRFTGPWPPYTFTPTIGGDNETDAGH